MKTPDFSSEDSGSDSSPKPNDSTKTTTTRNKTIELLYSETIIKSKQSKTSMKSLKLSKLSTTSVTTATSNPNKTTTNNVNQRSQSNGNNSNTKKKLKSFIKADDFNDDLDELMFLQMIIQGFFHIVKFIDHILYYVVSLICQLPLLLLKLLIPIFNLLRKFFNWLKSQLKKPIIIPRFYPFRCFSPLILVLDLDETLVHCTKERPDFEYEELMVFMKGKNERFFLSKRPYLEHFLEELSKFYTLVVFTSSQQEYADTVINHIDFKRAIKHRFYRQVKDFFKKNWCFLIFSYIFHCFMHKFFISHAQKILMGTSKTLESQNFHWIAL